MPVRPIDGYNITHLGRLLEQAQRKPAVRGRLQADVPDQLFNRIVETVDKAAMGNRRGMHAFWGEVYRDHAFLDAIARLIWHGKDQRKHGNTIFGLLALQQGGSERTVTHSMQVGSEFFVKSRDITKEAVTIASGRDWHMTAERTHMMFTARPGDDHKPSQAPFSFSISPRVSKAGAVAAAEIEIAPRQWIDDVVNIRELGMSVKCDGRTVSFDRHTSWIPLNDIRSFKGTRFKTTIPLTPHQSSCVSMAVLRGGIHTLFIHPIGL